MKPMKVYKLTDQKMQTYKGCQWALGETKTADGAGDLCGCGWLHWYADPLLAVLHNPIHAALSAPRLFEAAAAGRIKKDGAMKGGSTSLTLTRELPLPVMSTQVRIYYAILCARAVIGAACPGWSVWAAGYLMKNRRVAARQGVMASLEAARAEAARAEAAEAAEAARTTAAARAVWAAAAAAWAAARAAARAAAWAVAWAAVRGEEARAAEAQAEAEAEAAAWAAEAAAGADASLPLSHFAHMAIKMDRGR